MADLGVGEVAALALTAAATGASVYESSQAAKMRPQMPNMPALPQQADTTNLATAQQNSQRLAETAGGTILSDPSQDRGISNQPNAQRKTLLGS